MPALSLAGPSNPRKPEPAQYAQRDAAFQQFVETHSAFEHNATIRLLLRNAFNAGWNRAKESAIRDSFGIDRPPRGVTQRIKMEKIVGYMMIGSAVLAIFVAWRMWATRNTRNET